MSYSSYRANYSDTKPSMTKRQLIEEIRRHNATAQPQFLEQFDEDALAQYLSHLEEAANKRLRYAGLPQQKAEKFRMVS